MYLSYNLEEPLLAEFKAQELATKGASISELPGTSVCIRDRSLVCINTKTGSATVTIHNVFETVEEADETLSLLAGYKHTGDVSTIGSVPSVLREHMKVSEHSLGFQLLQIGINSAVNRSAENVDDVALDLLERATTGNSAEAPAPIAAFALSAGGYATISGYVPPVLEGIEHNPEDHAATK